MTTAAYGIDFGTTNSVLASVSAGTVDTVTLDHSLPGEWAGTGFDQVLPSVIGFNGSRPTFGWEAKQQSAGKLEAVKRLFATDDDVTIGPRQLKVEEAAAMFFRQIQQAATASGVLDTLDRAVVTIPANSRGKARFRTKLSAGLAGIEVLALINEPTAAAMAHARAIGQNQRILVFDWGGGTLDVTVLQASDGTFIEQASKGVQRLGGLDIDQAFWAFISRRVQGIDSWAPWEKEELRLNVELAKIKLSSVDTYQLPLPGGKGHIELTRPQFEEVVYPLIERTREPVDVCLRESPGRIDHLVMVGGSSKMPIIQRFIGELVGAEPNTGVNPMTAIAEGAALAAGVLMGTVNDIDFFVGTEHALGTVVHNADSRPEGEFSVLIRRNTKLPARATDAYSPVHDMQEQVNITVIEGDPALPIDHDDNVVLKHWTVSLLEPRPAAEAGFDITYEYDVDGILHVLVRDQKTGTVMMSEELSFGAAEDKRQLPAMRQRLDDLMSGGSSGLDSSMPTSQPPTAGLSAASRASIEKARVKIIPFVPDGDRTRLESLIERLENDGGDENAAREALDREIRNHAYLL
jgi:molecular chaperone DnaK